MSVPNHVRAAVFCATLSAALIAGMAGTAVAFTGLDEVPAVPASTVPETAAPTAAAPSTSPTGFPSASLTRPVGAGGTTAP